MLNRSVKALAKRSFAAFVTRRARSSFGIGHSFVIVELPLLSARLLCFSSPSRSLHSRLDVLRDTGYIEGGTLSEKGRFASHIYGYEIHATQLLYEGVLDELEPDYLNVAACSIVYEPKGREWVRSFPRKLLGKVKRPINSALQGFIGAERRRHLQLLKPAELEIAYLAWTWSQGATFENLLEACDIPAGDLVRIFRRAIQFHRQTIKAILSIQPDRTDLIGKLRDATSRIRRDVVDAEAQLLQSVESARQEFESPTNIQS